MGTLWDFPGGIHPAEKKDLSTTRPVETAGIPDVLILPLQQHIGEPANVLVSVGDRVLKGQVLAAVDGPVGVPVHAPTSGTVEAISQQPVPHPSGMMDRCITLRPDGQDSWCERHPVADIRALERDEVLEAIRNAGIAGMGGAGFPSNIKLRPHKVRKVDTLILNGAECEPYITADDMAMRERASEVIEGMKIMAWILRPERCVVAIEDNKPQAIAAIRAACTGTQIEVDVIPTKYPSGGERQLIQILTGLEVPHGGIPADIGVMCQNIGTAIAVHRAINLGEPLISRFTTITGEAVANPGNFEVLLGTPISYLLDKAGLRPETLHRLVLGGPMMGYTLQTTEIPVIKTTNCVIAATAEELPDPEPEQPCIRCGTCAEVCPMNLLPQQLYWYAKADEFDKAEQENLFDCIECGACTYVCPSSIPLVQYYRYAKGEIRTQRAEHLKADKARQRFEARQARLERDKAEKEAKRKERARAAAEAQARKQAQATTAEAAASDERAAKAAMVQEALARKQAAASPAKPEPAAPEADVEALEKQLAQAKDKLANMQSMLDEARAAGADNVEKLERAVAKNQDRVQRAQAALDQAQGPAAPPDEPVSPQAAPVEQPDLPSLEAALEKARAKLDNMQGLLNEALEAGTGTAEKLKRAVAKNEERVKRAEEALAQAKGAEATPPAPDPEPPRAEEPPDIATLTGQLEKARAKLDTMQGLLDEAREAGGDNVEKLERAVAKNRERVARAEQALTQAQQQLATQDTD
ncbi:MAG: electron transport complex subunit RsxC [Marinobacter sp.]|uniref:electron transport complex subunit RsxC n=1 Tax=Marinobacter sp. TaxID=50741 RepID=UPI00299ED394|nr:electron transport complex subunit RsxC [Marinobacter sp.]MDX1757445.1 electron transport complex subunit RsxC [Marinobacter sp.]